MYRSRNQHHLETKICDQPAKRPTCCMLAVGLSAQQQSPLAQSAGWSAVPAATNLATATLTTNVISKLL